MVIDKLCKALALREVYEDLQVSPGCGLLYGELQQMWRRTGLRTGDLEDALEQAFVSGDMFELFTHEGHMAILTDQGYRLTHSSPETLRQIEVQARALLVLEWARRRTRSGPLGGRRCDDIRPLH